MAAAREERRREREFYRYYHSVLRRAHSGIPYVDLSEPEALKNHVPRSSLDTALTAFCQLGALRLRARRCMILSFDSQNAYVLAEATRTLSLQDDDVHDSEDSLWFGHAILPLGFSICEHTINLASDSDDSDKRAQADASQVHVINTLQDDLRFCDQPFLAKGPKARFYAGVPLTSPNGVQIGVYCVLDDEPRDGLCEAELNFMCQMSRTVMDHLEIIRSRSEFGRGSSMLTSLDKFFKATDASVSSEDATFAAEDNSTEAGNTTSVEAEDDAPATWPSSSKPSDSAKSTKSQEGIEETDYAPGNRTASRHPLRVSKAGIDEDLARTYDIAARLIRDAADADGVVFLEPTNVSNRDTSDSQKDGTIANGTDFLSTDGESPTDSEGKRSKCSVLGFSSRITNDTSLKPISAQLMRTLLRRYPQGKVWLYDAAGEASSDSHDSASDSAPRQSSTTNRKNSPGSNNRNVNERNPTPTAVTRASKLQASFPGARALCLVSLWDPVREKAYAGALMWSNEPSRIFSPQGELSYVRAFCEVVTSHISFLEARKMDEMKTQFISSVSHELRSPLHGIIGSIDFLLEQETIDWSIILQIEKCSTSLMDVIDHLLDFAKINNFAGEEKKKGPRSKAGAKGRKQQGELSTSPERINLKVHTLSQITAEIVDVVYYSHCHNATPQQLANVDFILDVSTDLGLEYTAPVGSWKRICMNIVSNALKYTTKGYILVSLKIVQGARKIPTAILTVKDTGRGMSQEFLENRLFRAFTQEDNLATGTGLGLSLVAKLVKGLGGKIEVTSVKDSGSTVKVTVPLDVHTRYVSAKATDLPLEGLRVRALALPSSPTDADGRNVSRQLYLTALHRTLRHLGAALVNESPDVDVIWEADLSDYTSSSERTAGLAQSIVVLCDSVMSAAQVKIPKDSDLASRRIEHVARPYGPDRLLQGLTKCREPRESENSLPSNTEATVPIETNPQQRRKITDPGNKGTTSLSPTIGSDNKDVDPKSRRIAQMRLTELSDRTKLSDKQNEVPASRQQSPTNFQEMATLNLSSPDPAITLVPPEQTSTLDTQTPPAPDKLSLLLVDDNPINLRLLTTYATRNSHPWLAASDGAEAVATYQNSPPPRSDVIFMDINMPVMDGFEASRRIRALQEGEEQRPKIVALTGLGSDDAKEQARASGIDVFLTKPVRPRELRRVLEEIGEERGSEKAGEEREKMEEGGEKVEEGSGNLEEGS